MKRGLGLQDISPVHLVARGTAQADSVRCDWRGVARTLGQREETIRYWTGMDDETELPAVAELESGFIKILDAIQPTAPESARASFLALARGGVSTEYTFLSCYVDYSVHEYLVGDGPGVLTVVYDMLAEGRSYDLYHRAHQAGEFPGESLMTAGEYQAFLEQTAWDLGSLVSTINRRR